MTPRGIKRISKIGGNTKCINQREEEFLPSAIREFNYRQAFTDALDDCIVDNKWKYAQFTDAVYIVCKASVDN